MAVLLHEPFWVGSRCNCCETPPVWLRVVRVVPWQDELRKYSPAKWKQKACGVILAVKAVNQPSNQLLCGGWFLSTRGMSASLCLAVQGLFPFFFFFSCFKGKFFHSLTHIAKALASLTCALVQVPPVCDIWG